MAKITTSDFTRGMYILFRNEPHQIVDTVFVNPGKGSAFVRTKLKHLTSGRVLEFTYKSGESVESYDVLTRELQFLYKTDQACVFMDPHSYEQTDLPIHIAGSFHQFLKEGETYQILFHDETPLGMRYPKKITLRVTHADEAVKGNTVSGAKKQVTVETGTRVSVPLFIKVGDTISLNPETGEYVERTSQS